MHTNKFPLFLLIIFVLATSSFSSARDNEDSLSHVRERQSVPHFTKYGYPATGLS